MAHPCQERAVGIKQSVEPIDQHADGQQIEQRPIAFGFATRRGFGFDQPFRFFTWRLLVFGLRTHRLLVGRRFARRLVRFRGLGDHVGDGWACKREKAGLAFEPCRQFPRQFVEGVVLDRGQ